MHKDIKVTKLHSKTPTNWECVGNTISSGPVVHPREARLVSQAFQANDLHRIDVLRMVDVFFCENLEETIALEKKTVLTIVILGSIWVSNGFHVLSVNPPIQLGMCWMKNR